MHDVIDIKVQDTSVKENRNDQKNEMNSARVDIANIVWECIEYRKMINAYSNIIRYDGNKRYAVLIISRR